MTWSAVAITVAFAVIDALAVSCLIVANLPSAIDATNVLSTKEGKKLFLVVAVLLLFHGVNTNTPVEFFGSFANWTEVKEEGHLVDGAGGNAGEETKNLERYLPYIPSGGIGRTTINKDSVRWVQQCLRSIYSEPIDVSGEWTFVTEGYVKRFSWEHGFYDPSKVTVSHDMALAMLQEFMERHNNLDIIVDYCD